jgi:methionyl-tRNA formyltransferase
MIEEIIETQPEPVPQQGEPVIFKRRKPEDSNINQLSSLKEVYDYIRMLDAEDYPHAFLENEHFRLEFTRASMKSDHIKADVTIFKK